MQRGRGRFVPPPAPTGSAPEPQYRPRGNRLSRSSRLTQQNQTVTDVDSPQSQKPEFKTPTRISRSRVVSGFCGESPHNDSDFQQDIIWDAASPSPNRLGKRGKKHSAGAVDISEIVSRIAPKHGRPKVTEPTLQQWIGDSAAIPCTPDVQVPKAKKKSPRPNVVDDLLKLAKQFDFNMFHQDEEEVEDVHQQSLELLPEDILDFENVDQNSVSADCGTAARTDVHLDQHMEDDLDFLFDGPTQHVSGNLSQASSAQPSQFKPPLTPVSGNLSSHGPTSAASTTNSKDTSLNDEFDDDWENDNLLNDSLVFEMTQNPQNFVVPKHCSTQKAASEVKKQTPANVPAGGGVRLDQSQVSMVEKENVRQRTTFKLESNPTFSVKRIQTKTKVDSSSKTTDNDRFSSSKGLSVEAGSQRTFQTKSEPQKSQFHQRTSASSSKSVSSASNTTVTKTTQSFPKKSELVSSDTTPAVYDFQDEDLDCFFSSDLVWDDPADDNLLCEMCEDVENQIQSTDNVSIKQTPDVQRAALQPSNRTWDNRTQQPTLGRGGATQTFLQKQTATSLPSASGGPAGSSLAGPASVTAGVQVNTVKDSFRYTQTQTASGSTGSSMCLQGSSRLQSAAAAPRPASREQFTFKKPNKPVSTVTNTAVGKCSAAEIELKKQQAMERRRQRLQAAQNLRAPT